MHVWSAAEQPFRLHNKQDDVRKGEAKALSCYGLWLPDEGARGAYCCGLSTIVR